MDIRYDRASLVSVIAATVVSVVAFPFLPEHVPTHFDADGEPDRYSSRLSAAVSMPVFMAALHVAGRVFGGWPGMHDRINEDSAARSVEDAIGMVELSMLPAHGATVARALGAPVDMDRTMQLSIGMLFLALGNRLPKLPRNGLVGIRTPWTLRDPAVWERTHRVGGYLLMAAGLVNLLSIGLRGKRAMVMSIGAIESAIGISVAYSFITYRRRLRQR
jgi:uncharacterized membrane protein